MVVIVKIGGAIAYRENGSLNLLLAKKIMRKCTETYGKKVFFVVGCGNLLHEIAEKYKVNDLKADFRTRLKGYLKIGEVMDKRIARLGNAVRIRRVSPSLLFIKNSAYRRLTRRLALLDPVQLRKLPLMTYGGRVLDKQIGIATISSDNIAAYVAIKLHARKLVIATNTDGILDRHGKTIPSLEVSKYKSYNFITGGMRDKIRRVKEAVDKGIPTYIIKGDSTTRGTRLVR